MARECRHNWIFWTIRNDNIWYLEPNEWTEIYVQKDSHGKSATIQSQPYIKAQKVDFHKDWG